MTLHAGWSGWVMFALAMAMLGPMMRMMFGGDHDPFSGHRRLKRKDTGQIAQLDAALAERDVVIEDLQRRLSELESRLDFTERLLAERGSEARQQLAMNG